MGADHRQAALGELQPHAGVCAAQGHMLLDHYNCKQGGGALHLHRFLIGASLLLEQVYCCCKRIVGASLLLVQAYCWCKLTVGASIRVQAYVCKAWPVIAHASPPRSAIKITGPVLYYCTVVELLCCVLLCLLRLVGGGNGWLP